MKKVIYKFSIVVFVFIGILVLVTGCAGSSNDPVLNNSTTTTTTTTDSTTNSSTIKTSGTLNVSVTTSTYSGKYSPRNVLAIWIENNSGAFVKSLMVYAKIRRQYLTNWLSNSSSNTTDAVVGATLTSHGTRTCSWNGTDTNGNVVGDGTYKVCMEFTENDATGKFATFDFTKGSTANSQKPSATSNFSNIGLNWVPAN